LKGFPVQDSFLICFPPSFWLSTFLDRSDPHLWTCSEVIRWLKECGLGDFKVSSQPGNDPALSQEEAVCRVALLTRISFGPGHFLLQRL
jgi:hypothetical protein